MAVDYKQLYLSKGFFWNDQVAEYLSIYGDKTLTYNRQGDSEVSVAVINVKDHLALGRHGRGSGRYNYVQKIVGSDVVPAGQCHNENIDLLITEAGIMVCFADYLLMGWGSEGQGLNWRESMLLLLQGAEPEVFHEPDDD